MSLSWTKKHAGLMADVLDQDHPDLESAARAALDQALAIIEERGKWALCGQVHYTPEHGEIPTSHDAAVKVCLGLYESDTKANEAASTLTNGAQGDRLRVWVVPTFFGTPAAWHSERRNYYAALEAKAGEKRRDKLLASIAKREVETNARAAEIRAMEDRAGQHWPCPANRVKAGECYHDPACK